MFERSFLLNKKSFYLLVLTAISFNLFLRYYKISLLGHEDGTDSWDYHSAIFQIVSRGSISWLLSPFSAIGLYPPYYEIGTVAIYATLNVVTQTSTTGTVFALSLIFPILAFSFSFICVHTCTSNKELALIFSMFMTTSNGFLVATTWTISSRALATFAFIFFIYLIHKSNISRDYRFFILSLSWFIVSTSIHRLFIFALLYLAIYIFSASIYNFISKKLFSSGGNRSLYSLIYVILSFLLFCAPFFNLIHDYSWTRSKILLDLPFLTMISDLFLNYSVHFGLILVFFPAGMLYILLYQRVNFFTLFIINSVLIVSLFGADTSILIQLQSFFIILISSYFLYVSIFTLNFRLGKKYLVPSLLVSFLVISAAPEAIQIKTVEEVEGHKSLERWTVSHYVSVNIEEESGLLYGNSVQKDSINAISGRDRFSDEVIDEIENYLTLNDLELVFLTKELFKVERGTVGKVKESPTYYSYDYLLRTGVIDESNTLYVLYNNFYKDDLLIISIADDRYHVYTTDSYSMVVAS